jgi:hypothetical protein
MISVILENFQLEGSRFLREPDGHTTTNFVLSVSTRLDFVPFPVFGHDFLVKRQEYNANYGPYSLKSFGVIMRRLTAEFNKSKSLASTPGITRRVWILKQMYELFDASTGLLLVSAPNILSHAISKALEVLREPAIQAVFDNEQSEGIKNMISRSLEVIKTVCMKFATMMTNDDNLLKLLPTSTLIDLVEYAPPQMMSRFKRLHWIDPILADKAAPRFNGYWQKIWYEFFVRNFSLDYNVCFVIAEFMPMEFKKESFLDFFMRKYNTDTQEFFGEKVFDVEHLGNFVKVTFG